MLHLPGAHAHERGDHSALVRQPRARAGRPFYNLSGTHAQERDALSTLVGRVVACVGRAVARAGKGSRSLGASLLLVGGKCSQLAGKHAHARGGHCTFVGGAVAFVGRAVARGPMVSCTWRTPVCTWRAPVCTWRAPVCTRSLAIRAIAAGVVQLVGERSHLVVSVRSWWARGRTALAGMSRQCGMNAQLSGCDGAADGHACALVRRAWC